MLNNFKQKSLFITFEGCESSGKSTQSKMLFQWLTQNKIKATLTREPGGTQSAERMRSIILDQHLVLQHSSELLLHTAARIEHVNAIILPKLQSDHVVICDRFLDSTVAYQHYGHGLELEMIYLMHQKFINNLIPDVTIVFDVSEEVFIQRQKSKSMRYTDRYESMDIAFHNRVMSGFRDIAARNPQRCYLIDSSSEAIKDIHKRVTEIIAKFL